MITIRFGEEVAHSESFCEYHREYDECESRAGVRVTISIPKRNLAFVEKLLRAYHTEYEVVRQDGMIVNTPPIAL